MVVPNRKQNPGKKLSSDYTQRMFSMDRKKYLRWCFCYSCILLGIQGEPEGTGLVQLGQKETELRPHWGLQLLKGHQRDMH